MTDSIAIIGAHRTAIGSFNGGLSKLKAHQLGAIVIKETLMRSKIAANMVSEVILGQVLTAGQGQNPARQAAIEAGIPAESPAWNINQVCGSGLRAVALGVQSIQDGASQIVVAGGQESMSQSTHCAHVRNGIKMGNLELKDTMISDGLWDAFNDYHMGTTAENIARKYNISREQQDIFSVNSQNKAEAAQKAGKFKNEIIPIILQERKGKVIFDTDEYIRYGMTLEKIAKLRPAFEKNGTITSGNASGINDGAAALILMKAQEAEKQNILPLGRIVSWAQAGVDPKIMGIGPVPASHVALNRAGWSIDDLDLIEANEAFAAQALAVNAEIGWDPDKINVNGGAIAIGHPIGASGCRILVTLLHEMMRINAKKGLATLCIGGGMGIAMCVARD